MFYIAFPVFHFTKPQLLSLLYEHFITNFTILNLLFYYCNSKLSFKDGVCYEFPSIPGMIEDKHCE